MELVVKQENLAKAFNNVSKVASARTSLPILNNVLLKTNGSRLLIAATNLEIAVSQNIGAKVESPGSITVPARLVGEFISSLPKGNISLKVEGEHLLIESGGYKSKINGVAPDDFPELPTVDEESSLKISLKTEDFKSAVSQTVITTSSDMARPVLTGVCWNYSDGGLFLASTDGYRLSEKKICDFSDELSVIIPASSLQEVLRSINDSVEEIDVLFDDSQVEFRVGDVMIVSRLIDGSYIDYRKLIPSSTETSIKIEKSELLRIVKIASLFARDSGGSITLKADAENGKLSIHSIASEFGENTSEAAAEISGVGGEVTLNSRYLTEALNVINSSDVEFCFSGKLAPTVLRSAKNKDYTHIIMPLKS